MEIINNSKSLKNPLKIFGFEEIPISSPKDNFYRWAIINKFSELINEVFTIDYFDGIFFASWLCLLTEKQIINIINDYIFNSPITLSNKNITGSIFLEYEGGNRYEKLCNLQSINKLPYAEYKKLINLIKDEELKTLIPSKIICDTNLCNISFDIQIAGAKSKPGLLYTFQDPVIIDHLLSLYKRTFLWRENKWPYSEKLCAFIGKKAKEFINEK